MCSALVQVEYCKSAVFLSHAKKRRVYHFEADIAQLGPKAVGILRTLGELRTVWLLDSGWGQKVKC